jgi:hypothetical protein
MSPASIHSDSSRPLQLGYTCAFIGTVLPCLCLPGQASPPGCIQLDHLCNRIAHKGRQFQRRTMRESTSVSSIVSHGCVACEHVSASPKASGSHSAAMRLATVDHQSTKLLCTQRNYPALHLAQPILYACFNPFWDIYGTCACLICDKRLKDVAAGCSKLRLPRPTGTLMCTREHMHNTRVRIFTHVGFVQLLPLAEGELSQSFRRFR